MKHCMRRERAASLVASWRIGLLTLSVTMVSGLVWAAGGAEFRPNIYVPYEDLAELIEPAHKAVLMDRAEFERLLAAAEANARAADGLPLGQVKKAQYVGEISGEQLTLTGTLEVVSMSDGPVAVPLGFAQIGLTRAVLDGKPAPLGYDGQGRLTLTVTAKGSHQLDISGTTKLQELASGGTQFSLSLPEAVAGTMKLVAAGDLEMHATVPISGSSYDRQADRTSAELTLGGQDKLTVVLLGNGRQADDRAILLGESASTVNLTQSHQILGCLYTVQILRRGVRELEFQLPSEWTVTEVTCPSLAQWSVHAAGQSHETKAINVRLRSGKVGPVALHIKATARRQGSSWRSPRLVLVDAAHQRGYTVVNTDEGLRVRGEKLTAARREDMPTTASVPGLIGGPGGRLYFHWGDDWSVELELAAAAPRPSIKERQKVVVSPEQVTLTGEFQVTAIERELFEMSFVFGASGPQWQISTVQVDQKQTGFEYRIEQQTGKRILRIELLQPIRPEKVVNVSIVWRHVPSNWHWTSDAAARTVSVPMIESEAESVSGHVSISATGDLETRPQKVPDSLEAVPVGRMALLGMQRDVQYAYSYNAALKGEMELEVSRRRPRVVADAVGLIAVRPGEFTGDWRITYIVSRASAKRLYVLADRSLGQEIRISSPTTTISSKSVVAAEGTGMTLAEDVAERYHLWRLNLDHNVTGGVAVDIHYERPVTEDSFLVPLVRPICEGQISEQLAVQASEELALGIEASGAKEVDAIDLPPLPVQASRILAAFRLDAAGTETGAKATVKLETAVHKNYEILSALATSAELTTYLDVQGGQRTEANFRLANAGKQFLTMRLPDGAELWSLRVNNTQAKPQRSATGDYQVSLGQLGRQVDVRITYAYQPKGVDLEQVELGGVELPGVEMNRVAWTVVPPPGYRITAQETKMQTHDITRPLPAYLKIYRFLAENMFTGSLLMQPLARRASFAMEQAAIQAEVADRMALVKRPAGGVGAAPPPREVSKAVQAQKPGRRYLGVKLAEEGRFTLPVDLVPTVGAGPTARFSGLGMAKLIVGLTSQSWQKNWWAVGFALVVIVGAAVATNKVRAQVSLIIAILSIASLMAIWWPGTTQFANGAFVAGICLVPLYVLIGVAQRLRDRLYFGGSASGKAAGAAVLIILILCLGSPTGTTLAADTGRAQTISVIQQPATLPEAGGAKTRQPHDELTTGIIIPYEGDPTAITDSEKVLVPYSRYVELWNQAHPEDRIGGPKPGTDISLAAVRYRLTIQAEDAKLALTAHVTTYGKGWVVLGLPISGLAVTSATLEDKPAQLQAGPKGLVLMLPGDISGRLELRAVARPTYLGRRGSLDFSLPPLPAAVMDVILPDEDLELEADGIEGTIAKQSVNGKIQWTFGLGMTRKLALRWLPKLGGGAADGTLSASCRHDVYAFHWAIVGVTKITYSFSGGQHDRFAVLLPEDTTLTELKGTNIRDYRELGEATVENMTFKIVEARLYRPAKKQYELTVRWLGSLPALDKPTRLLLVRAGEVSRESGTVTLHAAGGMTLKTALVSGGRRVDLAVKTDAGNAELSSDRAQAVASYYWPYRPFALSVQLSRLVVPPKIQLDQLVRINADRAELLVQASLKAERGKLFGASFTLPPGYELLSAVGAAVENFYERSNQQGKFVHIKFHRGEREAKLALVLVCRQIRLEDFRVPTVTYIDSVGHTAPNQQGRVAVQLAASFEATTLDSENVKAISPQTLKDWLDSRQIDSVRYAYRYEGPNPLLRLNIIQLPTQVRVETFAGLVVRPTAAVYTYRLRYNIAGSPIDQVSFQMPSEYAPLVMVESPALRNVTQSEAGDSQTRWTVTLVDEVTGVVDVTVNFALPIEASTPGLNMPRVSTTAAAGYRAIVAVQNMSRHDISVREKVNLADLAASEQQKLMPREMRESLQHVFQSFEQDWSLSLDLKPAKMAARIQAVVDLMALTTVIDRNGRCRYEAKLTLQNRSEQFLHVRLPLGLRLWSAQVAGQPVKPVVGQDSPKDKVLIPLVKTSPGGLPYDVSLYFADEAARPLITPLNGIAKLSPPPISIVGIPVTRTTWSLHLPKGYRYVRPGGNMSPVAGTVEILGLGIEAKLEQLERLERTYRDVAGSASQSELIAQRNWDAFNRELAEDISRVESNLDAYRSEVSEQDYRRLKSMLGGQKSRQNVLISGNTLFVERQQEQARNDMNFFLNASASNAGVAEITRNDALLQMPGFVGENERQQIARLQSELQVSEEQLQLLRTAQRYEQEGLGEKAKRQDASEVGGKVAKDLVAESADKEAEMGKILGDLTRESAAQMDQKQAQLRVQLEELTDNRLRRHFQAGLDMVQAPRAPAKEPQPQAFTQTQRYGYGMGGYGRGGQARVQPPQGPAALNLPESRPEEVDETVRSATAGAGVFYAPVVGQPAVQPYVAKGIYSLPVTLPPGEIRLDFARPSGEAQISVWAVPVSALKNLYRTLTVLVAALIALGAVRVWPGFRRPRALSRKRIVVYVCVLVLLSLALGILGLLVSLFVILLSEGARRASASPGASNMT